MLDLSSSPLSLLLGDSIFARVIANNDLGQSQPSDQSDGLLTVKTKPIKPDKVLRDDTLTSSTSVAVIWDEVPVGEDGDSDIINYYL